jgi:hypothetical protein
MADKPKIVRPFLITKDPMIQELLQKFSKRSDEEL